MESNEELFKRAQRVMPGGVSSPVRSFKAVGGTPFFVTSGRGARLIDAEGNTYIDYVQSYGAVILGHADEETAAAIARRASEGTTFGAPTREELLLAETICERVSGAEMVRFVSSGGEATSSAIRLARAATGRKKVVLFRGCYHGAVDQLLMSIDEGRTRPASPGIPNELGELAVVAEYNSEVAVENDVACVIVEPVAANMGLVAPREGWLKYLRAACDNVGALLIFDEVITGFRVAYGGASSLFNIRPDLWCFGKVIGGGLPMGALAGPAELMRMLAPAGAVYQAGTLSGNPLACAAGLSVLKRLTPDFYRELEEKVAYLAKGLEEAIGSRGIAVRVNRFSTLLSVFFTEEEVSDYSSASASAATGMFRRFFWGMLKEGVALPPSPMEVWFTSAAHSRADLQATVDAADQVAYELARQELP